MYTYTLYVYASEQLHSNVYTKARCIYKHLICDYEISYNNNIQQWLHNEQNDTT